MFELELEKDVLKEKTFEDFTAKMQDRFKIISKVLPSTQFSLESDTVTPQQIVPVSAQESALLTLSVHLHDNPMEWIDVEKLNGEQLMWLERIWAKKNRELARKIEIEVLELQLQNIDKANWENALAVTHELLATKNNDAYSVIREWMQALLTEKSNNSDGSDGGDKFKLPNNETSNAHKLVRMGKIATRLMRNNLEDNKSGDIYANALPVGFRAVPSPVGTPMQAQLAILTARHTINPKRKTKILNPFHVKQENKENMGWTFGLEVTPESILKSTTNSGDVEDIGLYGVCIDWQKYKSSEKNCGFFGEDALVVYLLMELSSLKVEAEDLLSKDGSKILEDGLYNWYLEKQKTAAEKELQAFVDQKPERLFYGNIGFKANIAKDVQQWEKEAKEQQKQLRDELDKAARENNRIIDNEKDENKANELKKQLHENMIGMFKKLLLEQSTIDYYYKYKHTNVIQLGYNVINASFRKPSSNKFVFSNNQVVHTSKDTLEAIFGKDAVCNAFFGRTFSTNRDRNMSCYTGHSLQAGSGNGVLLRDNPFNVLGVNSGSSPKYRFNSNASFNIFTMVSKDFGDYHEIVVKPFVLAMLLDLKFEHWLRLPEWAIRKQNKQLLAEIPPKLWNGYMQGAVKHLLDDFGKREDEVQIVCDNFFKIFNIDLKMDVQEIKKQERKGLNAEDDEEKQRTAAEQEKERKNKEKKKYYTYEILTSGEIPKEGPLDGKEQCNF